MTFKLTSSKSALRIGGHVVSLLVIGSAFSRRKIEEIGFESASWSALGDAMSAPARRLGGEDSERSRRRPTGDSHERPALWIPEYEERRHE